VRSDDQWLAGRFVVGQYRGVDGRGRRLAVLLVEDDPGDAFLVGELLHEVDAPVDLRVVPTVADAKELAAGVDCVLVDLELPDASGLTALREIHDAHPEVAVVVLTGLIEDSVARSAVANGAQDYLVKSQIDGVVLERAIRYAVERRRAEQAALQLFEASLHQAESARLERGLLPRPLIDDLPIDVHAFYRPGRKMGLLSADFYDAVQTSEHSLSVLVGDVCGHAAEEAALGVELRVAWRALTLAGVPDALVLQTLDRLLVSERRNTEIFVTMAMAHIDIDARRGWIRTVGHPPPLMIAGDTVAPVPIRPSPLLGLVRHAVNTPLMIELPAARWAILLYTDGVIDGRDGAERLETDGLTRFVAAYLQTGAPLADLPAWLVERAEEANGGPLADDVAMVLLSAGGPTPTTTDDREARTG
jgi:serine phosphatase RsbU (regulator of sigma subunit)